MKNPIFPIKIFQSKPFFQTFKVGILCYLGLRSAHNLTGAATLTQATFAIAISAILLVPMASAGQFTLSWKDNSDNESGFKIERTTDGQSYSQIGTVGPNVTSYIDRYVASFIKYSYRVRAFNSSGNSRYSNVASRTLDILPTGNTGSSHLVATSIRARAGTGSSTMIAGIVVGGTGYKQILVRAIGPSLAGLGVANPISDPFITLYQGSTAIAQNNNWSVTNNPSLISSTANLVGAFPLSSGSKDSALFLELPTGAYTAHITNVNGFTGTALLEAYDVDEASGRTSTASISSISMRGEVSTGDNVIIAGFVVSGTDPIPLLIRAVGPELANYNISNALADPLLKLYQTANGETFQIAHNDNWSVDANTIATVSTQIGVSPLNSNSKSAAMVVWLEPGIYTAHAASSNGAKGVALVEVYEAP